MIYQVRFTSVSEGEDFANEHGVQIEWINDSEEFNRANLYCRKNIYYDLQDDVRVLQFNKN